MYFLLVFFSWYELDLFGHFCRLDYRVRQLGNYLNLSLVVVIELNWVFLGERNLDL